MSFFFFLPLSLFSIPLSTNLNSRNTLDLLQDDTNKLQQFLYHVRKQTERTIAQTKSYDLAQKISHAEYLLAQLSLAFEFDVDPALQEFKRSFGVLCNFDTSGPDAGKQLGRSHKTRNEAVRAAKIRSRNFDPNTGRQTDTLGRSRPANRFDRAANPSFVPPKCRNCD